MSEEAPKLRLRPKLALDPASADAPGAPPSAECTRLPVSVGEPPARASTPPLERLKPRLPGVATTPPLPVRPQTAPSFAVVVPPVAPAAPAPPSSSTAPLPSAPAPTPGARPATDGSTLAPLSERTRRLNRAALIIAASGVVVFGAVGYVAFPKLIAQQIEHEDAERRLEKLLRAERAADRAEASKPPPGAPAHVSAPPTANGPGPAATTPPPAPVQPPPSSGSASPPALEPNINFQAWVQNVRITGLRTGAMPRILIGGASFDVGEIVHPELGIVFDGYDADRRVLRFRDTTGALAERRHP